MPPQTASRHEQISLSRNQNGYRSMTPLSLLLLIMLFLWLWRTGQDSRDTAIATARETCQRQGLQFLDGTPALQKIRPCFSRRTGIGMRRVYTFDYSADGIGRKTGCIIMHNTQVSAVLLDG
jgi:hypothetical protein